MSKLATRLAIAAIDRRIEDAQASSDDPDFLLKYNSRDALQEVFGRLVREAEKHNHPLVNSVGKRHISVSLGKAFGPNVSRGNVLPEYSSDAKAVRQHGSAALQPKFLEELRTSGGVWSGDMAKELSLIHI